MKTRWKFLREGMKSASGDCIWKKGEWKHEDVLVMCNKGFHCSKVINQALSYVSGEILAKVQVKGESQAQTDKEVWTDMRIVKAWKWQKKDSVALAIYAAELCIENFERDYPSDNRPRLAVEAAKKWLENPTDENARAAYSAARAARAARAAYSAAYSAACAAYSAARAAYNAAYNAAYSAARAAYNAAYNAADSAADSAARAAYNAARAAYSAAYSAACAAYSAACDETTEKIEQWLVKHVKCLEEI